MALLISPILLWITFWPLCAFRYCVWHLTRKNALVLLPDLTILKLVASFHYYSSSFRTMDEECKTFVPRKNKGPSCTGMQLTPRKMAIKLCAYLVPGPWHPVPFCWKRNWVIIFQRINASHFCENVSFKLIVMANAKTADPVQHLHVLNDRPLLIITRGDFQGIRSKDSIGQELYSLSSLILDSVGHAIKIWYP